MAIDNNDKDDDEVGSWWHRHLMNNQNRDHPHFESLMPIRRTHFNVAKQPVPFPVVFRHTHCNACKSTCVPSVV
jgi:hypothetical protein